MPREEHILRQVEWKNRLEQYGKVELEKRLSIKGADIFADVHAQIEGKEFIIEIGDIADNRKNALLQLYTESKPHIVFVHEGYGQNKIPEVLQQIDAYMRSPEYQLYLEAEKLNELAKLEKNKKALPSTLAGLGMFPLLAIMAKILSYPPFNFVELAFACLVLSTFLLILYLVFRMRIEKQIRRIKQQPKMLNKAPEKSGKGWFLELVEQTNEENKKSYEKSKSINQTAQSKEESIDQSVYDSNPEATQEDDMEEDLALLDDEDTGW